MSDLYNQNVAICLVLMRSHEFSYLKKSLTFSWSSSDRAGVQTRRQLDWAVTGNRDPHVIVPRDPEDLFLHKTGFSIDKMGHVA